MPADSDFDRLDFRPGHYLEARELQAIVAAVRKVLGTITGGAGIAVHRDDRGNTHLTGIRPTSFYGKANGAISAASGDTPGAGVVTRYRWNGTAYETTSTDYDVLNPSTTTMGGGSGIAAGQRVWVLEDDSGNLVVAPLECS